MMFRAGTAIFATVLLATTVACTHSDSRSRDEARQEAQEAKDEAKRAAEEAKQEAKEAGREAAAEGRAAADEARRSADEAKREADEARREALSEAADARHDARREARDAGRDARNEARDDARDARDDNGRERDTDTSGEVVNLNSASAQEIASATGLSSNIAQKIVDARPYTSKRDLISKKIIDEPTYWKIQKHVTAMSK